MKKKNEIVIDAYNLYVQGLLSIMNRFMLEKVSESLRSEDRMSKDIKNLRRIFEEEKASMVVSGTPPVFGDRNPAFYKIIIKESDKDGNEFTFRNP